MTLNSGSVPTEWCLPGPIPLARARRGRCLGQIFQIFLVPLPRIPAQDGAHARRRIQPGAGNAETDRSWQAPADAGDLGWHFGALRLGAPLFVVSPSPPPSLSLGLAKGSSNLFAASNVM
jgi:hypothetical protein